MRPSPRPAAPPQRQAAMSGRRRLTGESGAELAALRCKHLRLLRAEFRKKLVVRRELALPARIVKAHDRRKSLRSEFEAAPVQIDILRLQPETSLHRVRLPLATLDDPFEHAHVLTKTGPCKLSVLVGAKPVDVEYSRRMFDCLRHREPMREIIADVIAAKRQHGERIAANLAHLACGGGGALWAPPRPPVYTRPPPL